MNISSAKFNLGRLVSTHGALNACSADYLEQCLNRHVSGDWGLTCPEDSAQNDYSLLNGGRIMSSYPINPSEPSQGFGDNTLWIITEGEGLDRVTTFLLPDEY